VVKVTIKQINVPCPNCGFAIPIGATWCEGCGAGKPGSPELSIRLSRNEHGSTGYSEQPEEFRGKGTDDLSFMRCVLLTCLWIAGLFLFSVFLYFGAWFIAGGGSFD
jgi:hypothetical protein